MPTTASLQHYQLFATCPRNTEDLLLDELRSFGATNLAVARAGVSFGGPLSLGYKACLWSRVASRILLHVRTFTASSLDDLYEGIRELTWEKHLGVGGTLAVDVTSTLRQGPFAQLNTHFAEQRVKDAVVDRFRAKDGSRPGVDLIRPDVRINVHLAPAETTALIEVVVNLDLSGDPLHRRGYRLESRIAPLKENLAAAILMRSGWPHIALGGGPLLDPMCGSGSLLIEGALMAADVAPGLLRDYFGFSGWTRHDAEAWSTLLENARNRRDAGLERLPTLLGFDADPRAVDAARGNAGRAGLADRIALERRDVTSLAVPGIMAVPGLVIVNPPYGKRLGEISQLEILYETLGSRLKERFSGWEAAVFTGNPELGARLGLRAHRVNALFNGPIPCKLLQFHIGPISLDRSTKRRAEKQDGAVSNQRDLDLATDGAEMFANRLQKNLKRLRRWSTHEHVGCYRVYDSDIPEYAVAVDLYENWAHVQEYAPPRTIDPVKARQRVSEVMAVVPKVLNVPADNVILKIRRQQRGSAQYQRLGDTGHFFEVGEGGLRFLVNLGDYLDTGLFLDHRITRDLIRRSAPGRRFLNLFAYTGAATVYAAAGGAISTTSVDLSLTYLQWARRNLLLNGFSGREHSFIRADCLEWLAEASSPDSSADKREAYDLIFLDAPAFSNSKRMGGSLDIERDHPSLIRSASRLLAPGGMLLFSTNYRRFKLDPSLTSELHIADLTKQTVPLDFARSPRIHVLFRIDAD